MMNSISYVCEVSNGHPARSDLDILDKTIRRLAVGLTRSIQKDSGLLLGGIKCWQWYKYVRNPNVSSWLSW